MKLLTKAIIKKAHSQYPIGSEMDGQMIVAKFFDPMGSWKWYMMNLDPENDDYAWGIVKGFAVEMGSFSIEELKSIKLPFGMGIERDLHFEPIPASECWAILNKGDWL